MNAGPEGGGHVSDARSLNELLLRLDRATETMELMDELGITDRDELQALMEEPERQIDDSD